MQVKELKILTFTPLRFKVNYFRLYFSIILEQLVKLNDMTGAHSAVGNVSGNRCESDCRSRGREFDP